MVEILEEVRGCVFSSSFYCFSRIFSLTEPLAVMMEVPPVPQML